MASSQHVPHAPTIPSCPSPSPQPEHPHYPQQHQFHKQQPPHGGGGLVRLMCSFGGSIFPRPHDNQLRYIGGETRIIAVHRSINFASLLAKLSKLQGALQVASIKYQLPHEELDALISIANDEDVENMMEEYDRITTAALSKAAMPRLRIFLFSPRGVSHFDSQGSQHKSWFVDALNGGLAGRLERGRSEVSSTVSEVPDYLFGLDSVSDSQTDSEMPTRAQGTEPHSPVNHEHPQPKADPDLEQNTQKKPFLHQAQGSIGFRTEPGWSQYAPQPVPVYYIPGPVAMPVSYPKSVQIPVINQGSVPPSVVYVGGSTSLGSHYGLLPQVVEGYDKMAMVQVYPTIRVEPTGLATVDGRASSQSNRLQSD